MNRVIYVYVCLGLAVVLALLSVIETASDYKQRKVERIEQVLSLSEGMQ